jgi:hypothetical protein
LAQPNGSAVFALHPINVESVAWASERKNVLSMMFFLLALYAYGWYARTPRVGRYAAVAGFFALALLCKPQVVAFPLLLLLWDYWPLCRIGVPTPISSTAQPLDVPKMRMRWLIVEKVPLLLLSGASVVVTIKAQRAGGGVKALSVYSPLSRFETAVISYLRYLGKALWPSIGGALSASNSTLSSVESRGCRNHIDSHHGPRPSCARPSIFIGRMVLVSWEPCADDRVGAGWLSGNG